MDKGGKFLVVGWALLVCLMLVVAGMVEAKDFLIRNESNGVSYMEGNVGDVAIWSLVLGVECEDVGAKLEINRGYSYFDI